MLLSSQADLSPRRQIQQTGRGHRCDCRPKTWNMNDIPPACDSKPPAGEDAMCRGCVSLASSACEVDNSVSNFAWHRHYHVLCYSVQEPYASICLHFSRFFISFYLQSHNDALKVHSFHHRSIRDRKDTSRVVAKVWAGEEASNYGLLEKWMMIWNLPSPVLSSRFLLPNKLCLPLPNAWRFF